MYQQAAPESIQEMFASIAKNYDRANSTFSFGLHKKWNQKIIEAIGPVDTLLDLCAGTGEISLNFLKKYPSSKAILLDFCQEMLDVAAKKGEKMRHGFQIIQGDAQDIPLADNTVEGVTIAYGIRNVKDPRTCFQEVHRVLKPGGTFAILENTRPKAPILRFFHRLYVHQALPILGKLAAGNFKAYRYLSKSIQEFSSPEELSQSLEKTGFSDIQVHPLSGGIATLIIARCTD